MSTLGIPTWGRHSWRTLVFAVAGVIGALVLGVVAVHASVTSLTFAAVVCALPLVPLMLARPEIPAVAAIAVLPFGSRGGGGVAGLQIGVPDLLLAVAFAGMILRWGSDPVARERLRALRPMVPVIALYLVVALLVSVAHPDKKALITVVQRFELVGVPLLIGATLLSERAVRIALRLFIIAAVVLATVALAYHQVTSGFLGVQKNPAGQFVADAALVVLATVKRLPLRLLLFAYLAAGMYFTYSRGAITGILFGLALLLVLSSPNLAQAVVRVGLGVVVALAIFHFLPADAQDRLLGNVETTEFNDRIRQSYIDDAQAIIDQHPYFGVGLGNYLAGSQADLTQTDDPHNVVLLETAEGGYPLIAAFAVLQVGALALVISRRRRNQWVPLAVALEVSIVVHALVDVYWVRGTPVLGWLVIGLALSLHGPSPGRDKAEGTGETRVVAVASH